MNQFQDHSIQNIEVKKPWWKTLTKVYSLILLIIVVFIAGVITANIANAPQSSEQVIAETTNELADIFKGDQSIDTHLFGSVWDLLHENYLDKSNIKDRDLFYGALAGMVAALGDPHSIFFDPQITEEFTRELNGSFFGIGAEIGKKDGYLVIVAPLADSPAEKAGIKAGDRILGIDDKDASELSVDGAVSLIRGEKNTTVILTVISKNETQAKQISITRNKIDIPSVTYKLENGIGIVNISNFNNDTSDRFAKVAQNILRDNPKGIIIDLRNNPGGYLDTAVDIASSWLDPDQVVVRETFSDKRNDKNYESSRKPSLAQYKTVVLVNEGSASAAEILAGALQDYGLATIVGQTTFGKGSVQQLIPLNDGSSVKLTVAKWLTPKGRTIDNEGIQPDIVVEYTLDDYDAGTDPQMDKAIQLLN